MMQTGSAKQAGLTTLTVRPVQDVAARAEWDRLMDRHHYPGFRGMVGGGLRHVAGTPDGTWVALPGWCAGAFKVTARDKWTGWAREAQFRRLHLVANNCRFPVLPRGQAPVIPGRGRGLRSSGVAGGDLCGPVPVQGELLPGSQPALVG